MEYYSNKDLSLGAKGLLSILLSGSEGDLVEEFELIDLYADYGKEVSKYLNELFKHGYLKALGSDGSKTYLKSLEDNTMEVV